MNTIRSQRSDGLMDSPPLEGCPQGGVVRLFKRSEANRMKKNAGKARTLIHNS